MVFWTDSHPELAALVQLWRTQMLPVLYLVIITALLVLLWLLVRKCLASRSGAVVARVLSVLLCAALAVGCVWAQQGLTALDSMTSGLLTGAEANKITKEPSSSTSAAWTTAVS